MRSLLRIRFHDETWLHVWYDGLIFVSDPVNFVDGLCILEIEAEVGSVRSLLGRNNVV